MDQDAAGQGLDERSRLSEVLHAGARGAVGAMAMTGMRVITTELGLVEQTPPQAIARQRARGARALLRLAPRKQRRGLIETAHWAFGAGGGAVFGALPRGLRRRPWAGPVYGLAVWLGFELGIAPTLGLSQAKRVRWSTAWRSPPTTCCTAWCYRSRAGTREASSATGPGLPIPLASWLNQIEVPS